MKKIKAQILKETEKAVLIKNEYHRTEIFEGEYVVFKYFIEKWLPKKLIKVDGLFIELPEWLLKKSGLKDISYLK